MRFAWLALVLVCSMIPQKAEAGVVVEASAGYALQLSPDLAGFHEPNIMAAVGYSFFDWVRLELGSAGRFYRY